MIAQPKEQRNPYKGTPPRPWVRIRLRAPDGTEEELDLIADTGNPCAVISQARMSQLKEADGIDLNTNFGVLQGGWVRLAMPEYQLTQAILGYASDGVMAAAQASSLDLEGLIGLPFLRLLEYGGDADTFWIRS
jgi:hypothetical protein